MQTVTGPLNSQFLRLLASQTNSDTHDSYSISLKTILLILLFAFLGVLILSRVRRNDVWSFRSTVFALFGIGIIFLFVEIPHIDIAFTHSLADALVIAAILDFTVDVYLKDRVLREVSSDVFRYLVGYRLPEEMQDRITSLLQTRGIPNMLTPNAMSGRLKFGLR